MANDDQTTSEAIASQIGDALTGLFGEASPSALFSEPIKHGDDLIVTAVAWERAGGFGFGAGQGQSGEDEIGTGEGGGGGPVGASLGWAGFDNDRDWPLGRAH